MKRPDLDAIRQRRSLFTISTSTHRTFLSVPIEAMPFFDYASHDIDALLAYVAQLEAHLFGTTAHGNITRG